MNLLDDIEKKVFRLRRDFYESTLSIGNTFFDKNVLNIVLSRKEGDRYVPYLIAINPVEDIVWSFSQEAIIDLYENHSALLITNIWLVTRYIENRDYEILMDGFPNWGVRIKIIQNKPLMIDVKKYIPSKRKEEV